MSDSFEGNFWLDDDQENKVTGVLDLSGRWPVLNLNGALIGLWSRTAAWVNPDGSVTTQQQLRADAKTGPFTIQGVVKKHGVVTLLGAFVSKQERTIGVGTLIQKQAFRCQYAMLGSGLFVETDDTYVNIRVQIHGAEEWVNQEGLSYELTMKPTTVRAQVYEPVRTHVPLEHKGTLSFSHGIGTKDISARSLTLWRAVAFSIEDIEPLSIDEVIQNIVHPLRTLCSICTISQTAAREIFVAPSDFPSRFLRLRTSAVVPDDDHTRRHVDHFMPFDRVGLEGVAKWLERAKDTAPIATMLMDTRDSAEADPSARLFQLAAAAEGLHRRLFDDTPRVSKADARIVRRAVRKVFFGRFVSEVWTALNDSLSFISQPSFAMRLRRLADELGPAREAICGSDLEAWVKKVKDGRNRVAHQLHTGHALTAIEQQVLWQSLYWLLTVLLLKTIGVDDQVLVDALRDNNTFQSFRREAVNWMPEVYKPVAEDSPLESQDAAPENDAE